MRQLSFIFAVLITTAATPLQAAPDGSSDRPIVVLATNHGYVHLELFSDKAPASVKNFLEYVRAGFYDGTIFHRVVEDFVVQGGGFTDTMQRKQTRPPVQNEADNGLRNERGTVAMARTQAPHSATSQFFVNLVDNGFLDHRAKTMQGWGYTVFARVAEGMDIIDDIAATPTGTGGGMPNVPMEPVVIMSARVLTPEAPAGAEAPGSAP